MENDSPLDGARIEVAECTGLPSQVFTIVKGEWRLCLLPAE